MSDIVETPAAAPARKQIVMRTFKGVARPYHNLGRGKIDCGDAVAVALRGLDLEAAYALAASTLATTVETLKAAYAHNNAGRQRMQIGNLLRARAKRLDAMDLASL